MNLELVTDLIIEATEVLIIYGEAISIIFGIYRTSCIRVIADLLIEWICIVVPLNLR